MRVQLPPSPQNLKLISIKMNFSLLEYILIISTLLEFNQLFQAIKSVKNKSVRDLSVWTFISIVTIGTLWLIYGITINNWPLIIGNAIKLLTALSVVIIYLKYKNKSYPTHDTP